LPISVRSLKIVSHSKLTDEGFSLGDYEYDIENGFYKIGEGNGRYANNFSKIEKLYIVDTPINTYPMILNSTEYLEEYYLQGFNWTIDVANEMYCKLKQEEFIAGNNYYRYNSDPDKRIYELQEFTSWPSDDNIYKLVSMMNGNKIENIPVLDYLSRKKNMDGKTTAEALSGTITINVDGVADELELYHKYNTLYPNVKIEFGDKVELTEAIRVYFYRQVDKDSLEAAGGDLSNIEHYFYRLVAPNTDTIAELIGNELTPPNKAATNTKVYTFTGRWYDWNDNKTVYYQDTPEYYPNGVPDASRAFSNFKPNGKDMYLVPEFEETERMYTVNFYNWDYSINDESKNKPVFTFKGSYESYLSALNTGDQHTPYLYYLHRPDDENITEGYRYALQGWKTEADFNNNTINPTLIDVEKV
jgi:hypothetical protein